MRITKAELVTSAVRKKQYPDDALPEIALAGRSNVGKSSFINRMIQRRKLARTSSRPGRTQTLNFYKINDLFYFVDVPGYGYAQVSKQERNRWGHMMEEYFGLREQLQCVVLITDGRHEPTNDDVQMFQYVKYLQLPIIVIATKIDKVAKGKQQKHLQRTKSILQVEASDPVISFSSETGLGKDEAWSYLSQFI